MFLLCWGADTSFGAEAAMELQPREEEWNICSQIRENGTFFPPNRDQLNTSLKVIHRNISVSAGPSKCCHGCCRYSLLFQFLIGGGKRKGCGIFLLIRNQNLSMILKSVKLNKALLAHDLGTELLREAVMPKVGFATLISYHECGPPFSFVRCTRCMYIHTHILIYICIYIYFHLLVVRPAEYLWKKHKLQ